MSFRISDPGNLRRHLETHSGKTTDKCNHCKYAQYQTRNLRTQMKTHSGEKLNQCNQCDYVSSDPSTLRTHLKRYSGNKSNKCNQCNFASTWPANLRMHLKSHSGEKSIDAASVIMQFQFQFWIFYCDIHKIHHKRFGPSETCVASGASIFFQHLLTTFPVDMNEWWQDTTTSSEQGAPGYFVTNLSPNFSPNLVTNLVNHQIWWKIWWQNWWQM